MTFDKANWGKIDVGFPYTVAPNFKYQSTADALATIIASGYFDDVYAEVKQYSWIEVIASDDVSLYYVNSATGATTVTVLPVIDASVIPDGSITNVKVNAAAAIEWSKMAALTDAQILVGSVANVATDVVMSGDATLANTGAITIVNDAITTVKILNDNVTTAKILDANVTQAKIALNSLDGTVVKNSAAADVIGGIPLIFEINAPGGATQNIDVVMTHKVQILDVWIEIRGGGTAGDTITVQNTANAITNTFDISAGSDKDILRATTFDDQYYQIAAAGTLRVAQVDGAGADVPEVNVYVVAKRIA